MLLWVSAGESVFTTLAGHGLVQEAVTACPDGNASRGQDERNQLNSVGCGTAQGQRAWTERPVGDSSACVTAGSLLLDRGIEQLHLHRL